MESWERIQYIMDKEKLNKNSFSAAIGINNNVTITRIINEKRTPSSSTLEKIHNAFPQYNLMWLKEGIGEILNDNQCEEIEKKEVECYNTYLLPMSAMGGSLTGFAASGTMLLNCESVVTPIANVDFAITIYGESMAPEYPSGSRVLIKRINPDIFIDWGKSYVLDTPNGVIIKEIHESEKEGYIKCCSVNPNPKFKPFDVPMNEIYGWYRVLMCMAAK